MNNGCDVVAWRRGNDGNFSNFDTYEALLNPSLRSESNLLDKIWRWPGPERIRMHLWKMSQGAFLTNSKRMRRGMTQSNLCPLCNNGEENLLHVFRDCTAAAQVWNLISESKFRNDFMIGDFPNWLYLNLSVNETRFDLEWSLIFGVTVYNLWMERNEKVFRNTNPIGNVTARKIHHSCLTIKQSLSENKTLHKVNAKSSLNQDPRWVPLRITS